MCGATHSASEIGRNPRHVHLTEGVCLWQHVQYGRTRTHAAVSAVAAAAEQQPEGWRFVPDTILPGYQWAPQWVPAKTPTVHWGSISGKALGCPNYSSAQQYCAEIPQTTIELFMFSLFLFFEFLFG